MIDGKKVILDYLRAHPGVQVRVLTQTPNDTREPWVQGHLIDMTDHSPPAYFYRCWHMQLDVYAEEDLKHPNWPQAGALGIAVREALQAMRGLIVNGFVVTGCELRGPRDLGDPDFDPPRPRTIIEADVYAHD